MDRGSSPEEFGQRSANHLEHKSASKDGTLQELQTVLSDELTDAVLVGAEVTHSSSGRTDIRVYDEVSGRKVHVVNRHGRVTALHIDQEARDGRLRERVWLNFSLSYNSYDGGYTLGQIVSATFDRHGKKERSYPVTSLKHIGRSDREEIQAGIILLQSRVTPKPTSPSPEIN